MKKLTLILMVLTFMSVFPMQASAVKAPEGAAEGGTPGKEVSTGEGDFAYVDIDTITVPVVTEAGVTQQFTFRVSLEVTQAEKDKIARFNPRLTDAYIQDLYGALAAGYGFMNGGIIDVVAVKQRLKTVTKTVLKSADLEAHDVLLKVVQQYSL